MPSTKGVCRSSTCQAWLTNSCSRRRAFSAFKRERLKAGLLVDSVELLDLLVGEFGIVDCIVVSLLNQSQAVCLWCEPLTKALNGPWLLGASRLPEQFRRFLWAAFGNQRFVECLFEACAISRFTGRIAAYARTPAVLVAGLEPGFWVARLTRFEFVLF